jgi:hypothetical protein
LFLGTEASSEPTDYPDARDVFDVLTARSLLACPDSSGAASDLLLGASAGVVVESQTDARLVLGDGAHMLLYDVTASDPFLSLSRAGVAALGGEPLAIRSEHGAVDVAAVRMHASGSGTQALTSVQHLTGGTLRFGGRVEFERATLSQTHSNVVDADFFAHSLQVWKPLPPTRVNSATGDLEYAVSDANMVGYQLVINDQNRLELNKYTRFAGGDGGACTHVTKLAAAFGTLDLTPDVAGTSDNANFRTTFACDTVPVSALIAPTTELWFEALSSDTGLWTERRVGIGTNDPRHTLHVVGDVDAGDKIVTNLPIESTSYMKAQTILTESDARVKTDVVDLDGRLSEHVIASLRPCSYTQLAGARRRVDGFIAQEVRAAVDSAVSVVPSAEHGLDDFHYLEAMPLISHLVNAVKALTKRVTDLESVNGKEASSAGR